MQKITVIIPAYNEEETIADVVGPVLESSFISDVLVVSDGSTDQTVTLAKDAGATVLELQSKGGKGEAMLFGLAQTESSIVVFLDADLRGLTPEHIEQLVRPVLNGERQMNVGLRDRGGVLTFITKHLPLISGERALKRSVLEQIPARYVRGFMAEVAINYYCRSHGLSYGATPLKGLSIRRKHEKVGLWLAVLQYMRMFYQVAKAMVIVRVAYFRGKF